MATVDEGLAAQVRNIEAKYGRPMTEWFAVIAASGLTKHTDVVSMLKSEHGLAHGAAHRVSLLARQAEAPPADDPGAGTDPAAALYTGKKAGLRPIHDALMNTITAFGDDIEVAPKKGYLSLRRRKQFAMIQPSAAGRIDIGLILPGVPTGDRLEPAAGFNALFTHRVRLSSADGLDDELVSWLRRAYERAVSARGDDPPEPPGVAVSATRQLATRHRGDDQVRFLTHGDLLGQQRVGLGVRQVLLAGEEPDERPPLAAVLVTYRAAQHRVPGLQRVEHRALGHLARDRQLNLAVDSGQGAQVRRKHEPDHGKVWTSTESTRGRSRTIGAQLSPESAET